MCCKSCTTCELSIVEHVHVALSTENRTATMMQATAVIERIRRAISETSDSVNTRLQPISSAFGKAFKVDDWAVELFAEEVVRGGPAFAVSLILSAMEPGFRAAAELGAWQLISPVNVTGKVLVVANLHEVQDKVRTCCIILYCDPAGLHCCLASKPQ